ncbi:TOG array regulator of axonemal microtubules protein 1-like [Pseudophryne corroboree]|uniref:TOG array regulator of axonemal microtubules protein 1-like n=1 Tax=Pseudophryne corroboree TaxID=495146 RepID=UPI003081BCE9
MFPPIKPNVHRMLSAARGKYKFPWELPGQADDVFPGTQTYVQLPAIPEVPRKHYGRCPDAEGRNSASYNIQLPKLSEIYNPVRIRPSGQTEMECIKPVPPKTKAAKHPPQRSSKVRRSTSHCPEATRPSVPRQLPSSVPSLGDALNLLCNNDWEKKIEGINMVRSLSASHPSVVLESLHALIVVLTIEVKNLSSKVSRAAIGCLAAMFVHQGKNMDREVEHCALVLLSRVGDSNLFIREEVDKALQAAVENVTPIRALTSLINGGLSHLNAAIRSCAAKHMCHLVERLGQRRVLCGQGAITARAIPAIARCVQDSSQDTRFYGRKMLHYLRSHPDFEKALHTYVPSRELQYIKDILKRL